MLRWVWIRFLILVVVFCSPSGMLVFLIWLRWISLARSCVEIWVVCLLVSTMSSECFFGEGVGEPGLGGLLFGVFDRVVVDDLVVFVVDG